MRFDLLLGVGDGVGEAFFRLAEGVGDGVGGAFFDERFRCLRDGVGLGSGSRTFLIFVPNDSSAAFASWSMPNSIAATANNRNVLWKSMNLVGRLIRSLPLSRPAGLPVHFARVPAAPFCETPFGPASDTDALQFAPSPLIG